MGQPAAGEPDRRQFGVTHTFTAAGQNSEFVEINAAAWFAIGGTFTGGVVSLHCSFDAGTTWLPYFGTPNEPLTLFTPGCMLLPAGHEANVRMRMHCDALATGSIAARLSGGGIPLA
jgi:hypothetical protein